VVAVEACVTTNARRPLSFGITAIQGSGSVERLTSVARSSAAAFGYDSRWITRHTAV
jgi:hypothetical protein